MDSGINYKFSRNSRLTRAVEFKKVFSRNFRINDDCITLLVNKKNSGTPRIGFAVAKKQLKNAVDRNRVKRLFRESFRLKQHEIPPVDIVVMVRYAILTLTQQELVDRIEKHWQKIIQRCANC